MINHIHLIWHIQPDHKKEDVQRDFLKYTAQQVKADLEKHHPGVLPLFFYAVVGMQPFCVCRRTNNRIESNFVQ
jgi:REP element-mobilizing transposase RayT